MKYYVELTGSHGQCLHYLVQAASGHDAFLRVSDYAKGYARGGGVILDISRLTSTPVRGTTYETL